MATKSKALRTELRTETVIGQAAVDVIMAVGGIPALLLTIALRNGTLKIGGVNTPALSARSGAIFPGSDSLEDDIETVRMLMRIIGIKSPELEKLLEIGGMVFGKVSDLDSGAAVTLPPIPLDLLNRKFRMSVALRRLK